MNQRQLQCFVAVATELHFGRAAKRLNMAQPPLSRHIKNLEGELGARLFTRSNLGVALTEFGLVFLQEARPLVNRFDALPEFVRQVHAGTSGILHLGAVGPALDGPLPLILQRFRRSHPDVVLSIHIMGTADQLEGIRRGRLHIGFIRPFFHDMSDLGSITVCREPYFLVAPIDHRLVNKKRISLKDLDGENLIFFPRASHPHLYDTILGALHDAGACVQVTQEADAKSMILAMVAAGLGIGFVPQSSAIARRPDVAYLKTSAALPQVEIQAIWNKESNSGALVNFVGTLVHVPRNSRLPS